MPEKFYCLGRTKGRVGHGDGSADAESTDRILRTWKLYSHLNSGLGYKSSAAIIQLIENMVYRNDSISKVFTVQVRT